MHNRKNENKYAREFVQHYKKYWVDKIFIYDNNDIEDEKFETVLADNIKNKYNKVFFESIRFLYWFCHINKYNFINIKCFEHDNLNK